ncbi:MAG: hypothetical protein ACI4II_00040 [Acutalibacteraceae bacterium]
MSDKLANSILQEIKAINVALKALTASVKAISAQNAQIIELLKKQK